MKHEGKFIKILTLQASFSEKARAKQHWELFEKRPAAMTDTVCVSLRLQDRGAWFLLERCHLKRDMAIKNNNNRNTGINHCHSVEPKHWHLMMCYNSCVLLQHGIMLLDVEI